MIQSTDVRLVWVKARGSAALGNHAPKTTLRSDEGRSPVDNENLSKRLHSITNGIKGE